MKGLVIIIIIIPLILRPLLVIQRPLLAATVLGN
jgi:hypothetical protein